MANILKSKYGDGHKVLIKDRSGLAKVRNDIPSLVSKPLYGIQPGKSVFELLKTKSKQKKPKHTIYLSKDSKGEQVFMKKFNSLTTYLFIGSKSVIQGMFDHAGDGKSSKSDTNDKTELKELVSLCVMEQKLKFNKDVDYDFVDTCIPTRLKKMFTEEYLDSAKKQLKLWLSKESGRFKGGSYAFERQLDNLTKDVYKNALELAKLQKDNWNPGDIWIVKKNMNFDNYTKASNIQQINKQLVEDYKNKIWLVYH